MSEESGKLARSQCFYTKHRRTLTKQIEFNKSNIMERNKIMNYVIIFSILQFIIIGIWFYVMKPESSTSLGILEIVFVIFGINLILGMILYFLQKRIFMLLLANSIICPLIFYAFWIMWFT